MTQAGPCCWLCPQRLRLGWVFGYLRGPSILAPPPCYWGGCRLDWGCGAPQYNPQGCVFCNPLLPSPCQSRLGVLSLVLQGAAGGGPDCPALMPTAPWRENSEQTRDGGLDPTGQALERPQGLGLGPAAGMGCTCARDQESLGWEDRGLAVV